MKKPFCVLGIVISLAIALLGVLLLLGVFTDTPSGASGASYRFDSGYASFGGDFYSYVNNNAAEAASAAKTIAGNQRDIFVLIRTASGIFITGFGLLGLCLFGAFLGIKNPETAAAIPSPAIEKKEIVSNELPDL